MSLRWLNPTFPTVALAGMASLLLMSARAADSASKPHSIPALKKEIETILSENGGSALGVAVWRRRDAPMSRAVWWHSFATSLSFSAYLAYWGAIAVRTWV